ncbi:conserved hypothetical protein [Formosa agariphila KMM 3901]|uniref:Uncharacterized protein n=1 Tax=Formosa agariphila (strain DSM 15362 / KCTC 12365 / LMG 23005 / KMM 3901 / M-2Alg 35-1) TaxID=1347342 RepID=T2KHA3_FORAG|nr:hypothetical protein [Formosa agariphila]CDF77778.1 conserved hypothetical protein [Formosa agariphila KMM 3901]
MKFNNTIYNNLGQFAKLMLFMGVLLLTSQHQTWAQTKVLVDNVSAISPNDKVGGLFGPYNMPTVIDPNNTLVDDDNYARLLASPGLVAGIASYDGFIELEFPATVPANTWSYVRMEGDASLFDALLGGSLGNLVGGLLGVVLTGEQVITIDARMGSTSVLSRSSTSGFTEDDVRFIQDALGNNYLAIRPNQAYDRLRINNDIGSLVGVGNEVELDVYSAFYFDSVGGECGRPFATSFDGDGGIGISLLDVQNQNLNNAIDTDLNTYSSLQSGSIVDLSVASSLQQSFYFSSPGSDDNTLNIKIALGSSGLASVDLISGIQVLLYDEDDALIYTRSLQSGLLNDASALGLLDNGDPITVTFAPGIAFSRAVVKLNSLLGVDVIGDGIKIYDVQRYDEDVTGCDNPLIAALPTATTGPLEMPSCAASLLDFENVDFPGYAVDGNNESYAVLNADAGNLLTSGPSSGFVKMDLGSVNAGQITYVRIGYDDDVLDRLLGGTLGQLVGNLANDLLLGNQYIQVQAYDAGNTEILNLTSQDFFGGANGNASGNVTLVEDNIGRPYLAIKPSAAYSSIQITNHVTAVLPTGKQSALHVYNACFETGTEPCFSANFTSYTGSGISLSLAELSTAGVTNPYRAINENSSDYSEINLGVAGVAASVYQSVYFSQPSQTGDHVKIRLSLEPSALLSLDLLGTYKIKFYNGSTQVGPDYNLQSGLINNIDLLGLFGSGGSVTLDFESPGIFDRVDVGVESLVAVGTTAPPMRLYEVSRYGDACPIVITPSPFEDSLCLSKIVDSENADELQNLTDEDFDSYATLNSGAGFLLGSNQFQGFVEMGYDQDVAAGVTTYVRIDFDTSILEGLISGSLGNLVSGVLNGLVLGDHYFQVDVKNNTYDVSTGDVTSSTTIASASSNAASVGGNNMIRVVQDAAGRYYIAVTPDQAYNAIRITDVTNSALGLLAQPNTMNVYGMCTEISEDRCLDAFATSYEYSGLNLSVNDVSGAGVTNPSYAIDDNTQHYSEISNGTLAVGTSTKQWIFFNTVSNSSDIAVIKFKTGGGGVDVDVLGGLQIKAYLGNTEVAVFDFGDGIINGLNVINLLNNGDTVSLNFRPGVNFDRISVGVETLVGVAVFPPVHLYGVNKLCNRSYLITNPMIYQKVN